MGAGLAAGVGACRGADDGSVQGEDSLVSGVHVLTQHNDSARTGANLAEKILNASNVTAQSFGKLFSRDVDGQVFAQPLYVGGVDGKNVVFVATEHNSVYAFDADLARASAPIWKVNLGPSVPATDTGCGLLAPEIGITSTPVIDLAARTLFVEAKTKEMGRYVHRLHALDLSTGVEKPNSPVEITARARGTGGGTAGGFVSMDPLKHMNRPGLLQVGNVIYIGFASNCDIDPYHGWVLAYDATTLQQIAVHVDTPDGDEGGIWHGGVGLAADARGDVYYASGNGTFDAQDNFGNSVVRLRSSASGSLDVQSFFTPGDSALLNSRDLDIGSTGVLLVPNTNLLVAGGKSGVFYVVDRTTMGGFRSGDGQIVQRFQATARGAFGGVAFYERANGAAMYAWGTGDRLKAFELTNGRFSTSPTINANTLTGYPGGQISVSANGNLAGSAIVWTVRSTRTGAGLAGNPGPGVLQAFDAANIQRELWSSASRATDAMGDVAKFAAPTIANGKVYVGTASNQLVVYGLLGAPQDVDGDGGLEAGASDAGAGEASMTTDASAPVEGGSAPTWTEIYTQYFGPSTPGHCSNAGCHANLRGGFRCGPTKTTCYQGLVDAQLISASNPAQSALGSTTASPLAWFGGGMPIDDQSPNAAAAAAITAWLRAGAHDD